MFLSLAIAMKKNMKWDVSILHSVIQRMEAFVISMKKGQSLYYQFAKEMRIAFDMLTGNCIRPKMVRTLNQEHVLTVSNICQNPICPQ